MQNIRQTHVSLFCIDIDWRRKRRSEVSSLASMQYMPLDGKPPRLGSITLMLSHNSSQSLLTGRWYLDRHDFTLSRAHHKLIGSIITSLRHLASVEAHMTHNIRLTHGTSLKSLTSIDVDYRRFVVFRSDDDRKEKLNLMIAIRHPENDVVGVSVSSVVMICHGAWKCWYW